MSIKLNGRIFSRGDTITFNKHAQGICYGPNGLKILIHKIRTDGSGLVGLYSPEQRIDSWSSLDGDVGDHRGYWLSVRDLEACIQEDDSMYEITKPIEHRGVQLKGLTCKQLGGLDDGSIFVEFDDDVNGCSADGLGKAGHCVAVSSDSLKIRKKKEKHAK